MPQKLPMSTAWNIVHQPALPHFLKEPSKDEYSAVHEEEKQNKQQRFFPLQSSSVCLTKGICKLREYFPSFHSISENNTPNHTLSNVRKLGRSTKKEEEKELSTFILSA